MVLDTSDCASRPVTPCSGAIPDADIFPFLRSCLPSPDSVDPNVTMRLELVHGCVSVFEIKALSWDPAPPPPYGGDQIPCDVKELSSVRFACGHETDCVLVTNEPVGPPP
jgi:hypothetical protein